MQQESSRLTRAAERVAKLPKARIVKRKEITHDLWLVWLEPEVPFTFKPGQYCTIGVEGVERAYSIVSAPYEPLIELFVELVPPPDGVLTPKLHQLQKEAQVSIRPRAKGIFTFEPQHPNHLMVSTVTGIVPFVSIIRDYLHLGGQGHNFYVLQGASYQDEFTYNEEMEQLAREHQNITYIPTVSRPNDERNRSWQGEQGRVNLIVEQYVRELGLAPEDTLAYACGHPGMIEDVKERLGKLGFTVKEERFWKE